MGSQVWSLLSLGVGLNLVLGALVAAFKLPIYLDSLGTALVAALAGPWPAALAGGCGVALLGLTSPTAFAFLPVGMMVGLMSGLAARMGCFRRAGTAVLAGVLVGCGSAALSAPISAYLFGGVTGGGTDLLVALFRAQGLNAWQASFCQGLTVDTTDKVVTFLLIYGLLRALPRRAAAAFPLAEKLPPADNEMQEKAYRPQRAGPNLVTGAGFGVAGQADVASAAFPLEAPTWLKVACLFALLLFAGFCPRPGPLSVGLLGLVVAYAMVAPLLTLRVSYRLLLALVPLALSLTLIQGLVVHEPGEDRLAVLGLAWSPHGLSTAWHFLARVVTMLFSLTMFLAATPLQRLAEFLLRCRVPYSLVFVLLTGANLAERLRERWHIVEEAQEARGLHLRQAGWWARGSVLIGLLTPTLGAVFSEIPIRAANLESRGFLQARPKAAIPLAWTGERPVSPAGTLFYLSLALWAGALLVWACS